ncbi:TIGR03086 family metal-binding protein [Nonomuraea pusilla]|uniref:TIGR03086 family protein n=1 Tax=Nonomuraea pusilla TaxID=46177 RepID=A0A1H7Z7T7_9ACTN|nr:TIGR03086 family metal-binding protein [Nonomuraea pusilla]SEM54253.1 TIGR03086 family protein [Nonomuraea pusilla]
MNLLPMMKDAAERTSALVRSIRDDELTLPTPCSEYDVKGVLAHLEWVASMFESAGRGEEPPAQGEYSGDFPERAQRMIAAWERPEAWEGVSPGMGLPKPVLAHMCLTDLVVHGWDLARATGRPYEAPEDAVAELLPFARQMAPMGRERGAFGPEVEVPAEAPAFDRLLGLIGRDPAWKP